MPRHTLRRAGATRRHPALLASVLLAASAAVPAQDEPAAARPAGTLEVRGAAILVDGAPYVVKGVHYSPWRPRTGPGRAPYPSDEDIGEDLALIELLHANTLLVYDAPERLLDLAWARGLRVVYALWIEWPTFGGEAWPEREAEILARVRELRDHPALLGWVLGNEVPTWVVAQRGAESVAGGLRALYGRVKELDPRHFVTHANWPNTRDLDLGFLDVCAFNLYALWPPEVVARGYGNFVREVLQPIAAGRPLLVSEYGTNSLEAGEKGQARLTRSCWEELRGAGAVGGFVFEFADEWWKNYSNPKMEGAWWDRVEDWDDHLVHDRDPEEYYGLVTAERAPKPAFQVVADLYSGRESGIPWQAVAGVAGVIGLAVASLLAALWFTRRTESGTF